MKKVSKMKKWTLTSALCSTILVFLLCGAQNAHAQKLPGTTVLEENFDGGKTLRALRWGARVGKNRAETAIPTISTAQKASGTSSLHFKGAGGISGKTFDTGDGFENIILEWKVFSPKTTNSLSFGLYGKSASAPLVRTMLSGGKLRYYTDSKTAVDLIAITPGEWITFRVEVKGKKYNVYMNNKLVGENLPTMDGNTKATRIYASMGGNAEAFIDDVKVSYVP